LYTFSEKILSYLASIQPSPRGEYELQDAMTELFRKDGRIRGMMLPDRIDLTLPEDLLRLNLNFLKNGDFSLRMAEENHNHWIPPVLIEKQTSIGEGCQIGPCVYIESGAKLGDHVKLDHCVVLRSAEVPTGAALKYKVIW
jgi:NDP-sugar pyrophosphorylase family protein